MPFVHINHNRFPHFAPRLPGGRLARCKIQNPKVIRAKSLQMVKYRHDNTHDNVADDQDRQTNLHKVIKAVSGGQRHHIDGRAHGCRMANVNGNCPQRLADQSPAL